MATENCPICGFALDARPEGMYYCGICTTTYSTIGLARIRAGKPELEDGSPPAILAPDGSSPVTEPSPIATPQPDASSRAEGGPEEPLP